MGHSQSSESSGKVVGYRKNGNNQIPIYEEEAQRYRSMIGSKLHIEGDAKNEWGMLDGQTYYTTSVLSSAKNLVSSISGMQLSKAILDSLRAAGYESIKISSDVMAKVVRAAGEQGAKIAAQMLVAAITQELPPGSELLISGVEKAVEVGINTAINNSVNAAQAGIANYKGSDEIENLYTDSMWAYQGAAECIGANMGIGYNGGYDQSFGGNQNCPCTGGWIGGDDMDLTTAKDYSNSVNMLTKDKIIDQITDAVAKLGFKVEGTSRQDKVRSLLKIIPDGDKFVSSNDAHKRICSKIAEVINAVNGNKVINTSLPADVQCQQIAEIVSSLAAGMHSEFLSVYNDVRRVLKNLHVLKESLSEDFNLIKEKISSSDDSNLQVQTTTLSDLHDVIIEEVNRQIQLLQNLLNVTLFPTEKDLAALIKNKKDIYGYIEKIDVKPGNEKFGKVISDILKGLGITANFALLINRALKTIGISVDEYSKNDSVSILREKITQNLLNKTFNESQLHEYMQAAELLYKNFYRKEDIATVIEKEKIGNFESDMSYNHSYTDQTNDANKIIGGLIGDDRYHRTVMDKRISDRQKLKNLIFTAFYKRISDIYISLIEAMEQVSKKIGTEIPLSDQLDGFRHVIQRINESLIRNKNIYQAIIGYYNDALSKSKRDEILSNLRSVSSYIDSITEMDIYRSSAQYFRDIQAQIKALIEVIDKYSDEIASKFGRGETTTNPEQCESIDEIKGGYTNDLTTNPEQCENIDEIKGGYTDVLTTDPEQCESIDGIVGGYSGEDDEFNSQPKIIVKTTKSINDAFRKFDYYYRVAQIKANLSRSSKELDNFSEKYDKIIASGIVDVLDKQKIIYERIRKELADSTKTSNEIKVDNAFGFDTVANASVEKEAALEFLDAQWSTRKKFWATVEAIDIYMKVFTDGLVKNPNDIREIKSMLDDIEIINDWYNENSGNDLAGVFDYFPSNMSDMSLGSPNNTFLSDSELVYPPDSYRNQDTREEQHYYQKISDAYHKGVGTSAKRGIISDAVNKKEDQKVNSWPGHPYLVTTPSMGLKARNQIRKTMMGLGVLKNLISVFVHIGSKFGGEELRKKIFLTPTQIYNNLVEYLQASTFAQGFGIAGATGNNFNSVKSINDPLPDTFYDNSNICVLKNLLNGNIVNNATINGVVPVTRSRTTYTRTAVVLGVSSSQESNRIAAAPTPHIRTTGFVPLPTAYSLADQTGNVDRLFQFKKQYGIWMRSVIGRNTNNGLSSLEGIGFRKEDDYFVLILKSIAAKIFTVTGMYDIIDRPLEINSLSPIRMIIGGADDIPKIEDGAVELYLRLPLLAQFYRNIFGFEKGYGESEAEWMDAGWAQYTDIGKGRRDTWFKISMVPDVDGVFSGLIKFIFRKAKFIQNNIYSDDDVKEIIREINLIYQRMQSKYAQNTVMETIYEFVTEINRRYGIVSRSERDKYEKEFGYRYDYFRGNDTSQDVAFNRYSESANSDFAILPGETEEEVVRPSAAEKLLSTSFNSSEKESLFTISKEHKEIVYKFRCAIDKLFENPNEEYTFKNAIRVAQAKLKHETADEERVKIVISLVRGIDIYSKADGMKYVMFHETVIAGLNLLSAVHSLLQRFKRKVLYIDLYALEDKILNFFSIAGDKTFGELHTMITNYYMSLGLGDAEDHADNYAKVILGWDEARNINGGHAGNSTTDIKRVNGIITNINREAHDDRLTHNYFKTVILALGHAFPANAVVGRPYLTIRDTDRTNPRQAGIVNSGGLSSILSGFGVDDLKDALRGKNRNPDLRRRIETYFRFRFNREFIMKELIESVFGISYDLQGLVSFKLEDGKLFLNFGGLKTVIEEMFTNISYFLDILKPHIKPEIIEKYTNKTNPGSLYWLQEQLIEKIIIGRPGQVTTEPGESAREGYINLGELSQKINSTYQILTKEYDSDGSGLFPVVHNNYSDVSVNNVKNRTSYDKVFAELIFYDASRPASGLNISDKYRSVAINNYEATNDVEVVDFKGKLLPFELLHFSGILTTKQLDTRYAARFKQLYTWTDEYTPNRSVLFAFNQLVAKFIYNFFDTTTTKIYSNLLQGFANGAFNRAIMEQTATYPDTAPLFMFKSEAPETLKYNNILILKSRITDINSYNILLKAVRGYLTYGISSNPTSTSSTGAMLLNSTEYKSKLLYYNNPEFTRTVTLDCRANGTRPSNLGQPYSPHVANIVAGGNIVAANTAGGSLDVHPYYPFLLIYIIADIIHKMIIQLRTNVAGGMVALNAVPTVRTRLNEIVWYVISLGTTGTRFDIRRPRWHPQTFLQLINFYLDKPFETAASTLPTYEQIVNKLIAPWGAAVVLPNAPHPHGGALLGAPAAGYLLIRGVNTYTGQHIVNRINCIMWHNDPLIDIPIGAPHSRLGSGTPPFGLITSSLFMILTAGHVPANVVIFNEWNSLGIYLNIIETYLTQHVDPFNVLSFGQLPVLAARMNYIWADDMLGLTAADFDERTEFYTTLWATLGLGFRTAMDIYMQGSLSAQLVAFANSAAGAAAIANVNAQPPLYAIAANVPTQPAYNANGFSIESAKQMDAINGALKSAPSINIQSFVSNPKTIIRAEEAMAVIDSNIFNHVGRPGESGGYLRLVRNEADPPFIGANPWGHLQITPPGVLPPLNLINNRRFGQRYDPDGEHVLFTSLSIILKNIITTRHPTSQLMIYIQDNISDVNLFMKEKYKTMLPLFKFLLSELSNKSEYLKKFMNRPEINLERRWNMMSPANLVTVPSINPWPWVLQHPAPETVAGVPTFMTSKDAKIRFTNILDGIDKGLNALIQTCEQVYREVADDPKYFELGQNFIRDYKLQHNTDPLMPLSSTLAILRNVDGATYNNFLPVHAPGTNQFKFIHGTRLLLNQPNVQPQAEHNPGWAQIIEAFNLIGESKSQIDKTKADSYMKSFVKMIRYIYEAKHIKGVLTPYMVDVEDTVVAHTPVMKIVNHYSGNTVENNTKLAIGGLFTRDDLVITEKKHGDPTSNRDRGRAEQLYSIRGPVYITNKADISIITDQRVPNWRSNDINKFGSNPRTPIPVYSITNTLSETIKLTESSFKDDRIKDIVDHILNNKEQYNSMEIQNIIDLNIVPINVHALMREIPLANLYNYAYTFDRLIIELYYGFQNENARKLISELCNDNHESLKRITTAKDMLVQLLLQPYINVYYNDLNELPNNERSSAEFNGINYYEKFVKRVLVGSTGNELGRPKFLSDQLFNKVLFGEVYHNSLDYDEKGPSIKSSIITKDLAINIIQRALLLIVNDLCANGNAFSNPNTGIPQGPNFVQVRGPSVNFNSPLLPIFMREIAKYLVEHPTVSMIILYQRILEKLLDGEPYRGIVPSSYTVPGAVNGAPVIGALAITEPDERLCALAISYIGVVISQPFMGIFNDLARGIHYKHPTAFTKYWDRISIGIAMIHLTSLHAGDYLGTAYIPPGGGVRASATEDEALSALFYRSIDINHVGLNDPNWNVPPFCLNHLHNNGWVNPPNPPTGISNSARKANYIMSDETFQALKQTAKRIVSIRGDLSDAGIVMDLTQIVVNNNIDFDIRAIITLLSSTLVSPESQGEIGNILDTTNVRSMSTSEETYQELPSELHWLAEGDNGAWTENSGPGSVAEPPPYGDNENVFNVNQIKSVDIDGINNVLYIIGRHRFDTVFIRNLLFIVNLYRSVRYKLSKDLTYNRDIILKSAAITRVDTTEFYGNSIDRARIPYGESDPRFRRYNY